MFDAVVAFIFTAILFYGAYVIGKLIVMRNKKW